MSYVRMAKRIRSSCIFCVAAIMGSLIYMYICLYIWNMFWTNERNTHSILVIQVFLFSYSMRVLTLYSQTFVPLLLLLLLFYNKDGADVFCFPMFVSHYLSFHCCVCLLYFVHSEWDWQCAVILCVVHVLSGLKLYIISIKTVIFWRITAYRYLSVELLNLYRLNVMWPCTHLLNLFLFRKSIKWIMVSHQNHLLHGNVLEASQYRLDTHQRTDVFFLFFFFFIHCWFLRISSTLLCLYKEIFKFAKNSIGEKKKKHAHYVVDKTRLNQSLWFKSGP